MLTFLLAYLPFSSSPSHTLAPPSSLPSSPSAQDEVDDPPLPLSSSIPLYLPKFTHPFLRNLLISSLSVLPRPAHIAFIMDGNRRSARERSLPVRVGHEEGFEALKRVLSFLLRLGIPHVTVYAFSIENFNRSPEEVEALMGMARNRLVEICRHGCVLLFLSPSFLPLTDPCSDRALLQQHGVQIRVLGRRDLLPPDVQASCEEAERMTAHNTRCASSSLSLLLSPN